MGKRISDWLRRISTGWVALAALLIFLLFSALVLPQQATKAEKETGSPDSPDMSFFYSPSDLYEMAEAYGEQGRKAYVEARFTFDLIWPLVYTLFLATAISWVFGRAFGEFRPAVRRNRHWCLALDSAESGEQKLGPRWTGTNGIASCNRRNGDWAGSCCWAARQC